MFFCRFLPKFEIQLHGSLAIVNRCCCPFTAARRQNPLSPAGCEPNDFTCQSSIRLNPTQTERGIVDLQPGSKYALTVMTVLAITEPCLLMFVRSLTDWFVVFYNSEIFLSIIIDLLCQHVIKLNLKQFESSRAHPVLQVSQWL